MKTKTYTIEHGRKTIHLTSNRDIRNMDSDKIPTGTKGFEINRWRSLSDYMGMEGEPLVQGDFWRREAFDYYLPEGWPSRLGRDSRFYGAATIEEVQEAWDHGFMADEIVTMGKELAAKAEGLVVNRKRKRVYGAHGPEICADRWANGAHDTAFIHRPRHGAKSCPIASLAFNWGANCDMTGAQLKWTGVAAAALCHALESAGWSVGLNACPLSSSTRCTGWDTTHIIPAKQPEEPLRPGQLGSIFAHPASYRLRHFMAKQTEWVSPGSNLGHHNTLQQAKPEMIAALRHLLPGNAVFVDSSYNREQALASVEKALEQVRNPMTLGD